MRGLEDLKKKRELQTQLVRGNSVFSGSEPEHFASSAEDTPRENEGISTDYTDDDKTEGEGDSETPVDSAGGTPMAPRLDKD